MSDSFQTRLATLSEAELRDHLVRHLDYRTEAVAAVVKELARRGQALSEQDWQRLRSELVRRDALANGQSEAWRGRLLGRTQASRTFRIRLITGSILLLGLGSATGIYLTARARLANPLGYEPEDTKKYLRQLEMVGGKANVLASEFRQWFDGLWHGRSLAFTLAGLTLLLAFGFWFCATHLGPDLDAGRPDPPEGGA